MRTIIVDDEVLMIRRFVRLSENIPDINIVGQFDNAASAIQYARCHPIDLAFLDVAMPIMDGIELAKELRTIRPDILIVFITAYDKYVWDFNKIGGDYYILKPYDLNTIEMVMERIRLIARRQNKNIYIQTFGRFVVFKDDKPIQLVGKAKEILALVVSRRGKEISNEEIYSTVWEGREYSNVHMNVYYNALRRLKKALQREGIEDILLSTRHGQIANVDCFDCDYYDWIERKMDSRDRFCGEFLSEYSWGECMLAEMLFEDEL